MRTLSSAAGTLQTRLTQTFPAPRVLHKQNLPAELLPRSHICQSERHHAVVIVPLARRHRGGRRPPVARHRPKRRPPDSSQTVRRHSHSDVQGSRPPRRSPSAAPDCPPGPSKNTAGRSPTRRASPGNCCRDASTSNCPVMVDSRMVTGSPSRSCGSLMLRL